MGDKRMYTFLKVINPDANLTVRLEFEIAYFDITIKQFSLYTTANLLGANEKIMSAPL